MKMTENKFMKNTRASHASGATRNEQQTNETCKKSNLFSDDTSKDSWASCLSYMQSMTSQALEVQSLSEVSSNIFASLQNDMSEVNPSVAKIAHMSSFTPPSSLGPSDSKRSSLASSSLNSSPFRYNSSFIDASLDENFVPNLAEKDGGKKSFQSFLSASTEDPLSEGSMISLRSTMTDTDGGASKGYESSNFSTSGTDSASLHLGEIHRLPTQLIQDLQGEEVTKKFEAQLKKASGPDLTHHVEGIYSSPISRDISRTFTHWGHENTEESNISRCEGKKKYQLDPNLNNKNNSGKVDDHILQLYLVGLLKELTLGEKTTPDERMNFNFFKSILEGNEEVNFSEPLNHSEEAITASKIPQQLSGLHSLLNETHQRENFTSCFLSPAGPFSKQDTTGKNQHDNENDFNNSWLLDNDFFSRSGEKRSSNSSSFACMNNSTVTPFYPKSSVVMLGSANDPFSYETFPSECVTNVFTQKCSFNDEDIVIRKMDLEGNDDFDTVNQNAYIPLPPADVCAINAFCKKEKLQATNEKKRASDDKNHAQYTLIVNVPPQTTRQDLHVAFNKFGRVDLTVVVCDKQHRHPNKEWTATSGYAFVRFATREEAEAAVAAAAAGCVRLRGSRIRATWAKKDSMFKHNANVNRNWKSIRNQLQKRSAKNKMNSELELSSENKDLLSDEFDPHIFEGKTAYPELFSSAINIGNCGSVLNSTSFVSSVDVIANLSSIGDPNGRSSNEFQKSDQKFRKKFPYDFEQQRENSFSVIVENSPLKVPLTSCLSSQTAKQFCCLFCVRYISWNPVILPCWHIFCSNCLELWMKQCSESRSICGKNERGLGKDNEKNSFCGVDSRESVNCRTNLSKHRGDFLFECPECRCEFNPKFIDYLDSISQGPLLKIQQALYNEKIVCINYPACSWTGELRKYRTHIIHDCQHVKSFNKTEARITG